ncbi:MAG: beta-galactosidase [Pirellulales bacterium]|nr:beta-galactosidase [Pirellulales bacterium]
MSKYTYQDGRYWKDGAPWFAIASDYQYYRDARDNWRDRLEKLRDGGVELITFYTPWRHHLQCTEGKYWLDFEGQTKDSRDLIGFLKLVKELDLLMIVKPGPFVHSELNVGGLPDLVCPLFNPGMPAARRHHGRPNRWTYDNSILPAPLSEEFDSLVKEFLGAVGKVITPYCSQEGPCIGLQLNDETIYCMSNDPPWHIGYEPSGMRYYQQLVTERYGDIATYNRLHGTEYPAFDFVPGPRLELADDAAPKNLSYQPAKANTVSTAEAPGPRRREDLLRYVDWAEYQWRLRRDIYVRYEKYLGISHLPYLTNYAGITPPIEENVPDLKEGAAETIPADYRPLYSEWWFAMNRIEQDADAYEYGMISWLGVASYDRDVFDRYVNTARRARGINMEENWGFGTLYDAKSRYPLVPFFQTLASVAAGATGYDIFVGVGTAYWDETLDRITKLQCPTFPSHAPIDEHGNFRPMWQTATMMNRWFAEHGSALLSCDVAADCAYLLYAPYAAVSSWVPDERYWGLEDKGIPRCGHQGFEAFSSSLQAAGYGFAMYELEAATPAQLHASKGVAIHSAFYMDDPEQQRLAEFIEAGGRLFISGDLPEVNLRWEPCTLLKEAVEAAVKRRDGKVVYDKQNMFAEGKFAERLAQAGFQPSVTYSQDMRAYVHRGERDAFVFFFNFDLSGKHQKRIEFDGLSIQLQVGSKTSGVLRITDNQLVAWMVKGKNEVENIEDEIRIRLDDKEVVATGDFSSSDK